MKNSLITVYITNYNYGKYIKQSIESVLNQTYQNFELIIIDDGSTDNSISIIKEYENNDKIQVIRQSRKGLNCCNNIALSVAHGKYVVRLDADDYFMPNAINKMVHLLKDNEECALLFPDYHMVDANGNVIKTIRRHNFNDDVTLFDQPAHGACTMIKTSVLKDIGGYDEEFDRQDGYDIWLKIINKYQVKNINEPLFCYRQHGSNLTKNNYKLLRTRAKIKAKHVRSNNYNSLNILTIIPVRGSLIDPSSNPLNKLGDKPLIDWSLESVLDSEYSANIIVSTPDLDIQNHVKQTYQDKISIVKRNPEFARINVGIDSTIDESLSFFINKDMNPLPDAILILYIDYPFKQSWQIEEAIHTMMLYDVDIVDGIIPDDRIFYQHNGKGLNTLIEGGGLHMERDELYRRVGGVHLIKTDFFLKHKKMISGKIGHIQFDITTAFQIKTSIDWDIAETILSKTPTIKKNVTDKINY